MIHWRWSQRENGDLHRFSAYRAVNETGETRSGGTEERCGSTFSLHVSLSGGVLGLACIPAGIGGWGKAMSLGRKVRWETSIESIGDEVIGGTIGFHRCSPAELKMGIGG